MVLEWTGPCGHGKMRQRDVLWLWIMIGSQRTCPGPSKQRPMCAYVVGLGQRAVRGRSPCARDFVAWPSFSSSSFLAISLAFAVAVGLEPRTRRHSL